MGSESLCEIIERKLNGKKLAFSNELKKFAITLQYYSSKAYNFVRIQFSNVLPHPRILNKWYHAINEEPGFTKETFNTLKLKVAEIKLSLEIWY